MAGGDVRDLRNILPAGFRAAPNVHLGSGFEIDVTTCESATAPDTDEAGQPRWAPWRRR